MLVSLVYLHRDKKIIYRDLKLDSLLLDAKGKVKLFDLGLSMEGLTGLTFCEAFEVVKGALTRQSPNQECQPVGL